MSDYNYTEFSSDHYDFDAETGPAVGQRTPNFSLETLAGATVELLAFEGAFLVLEMGSITCPLFQSRRQSMGHLHDNPRVSSAVLYVREAHPGASIPGHQTVEDKRACAGMLASDGERRRIFVDDMAGTAHEALGGMPNAVFILNREGCVLFRADWNNPRATAKALTALLANEPIVAKSYFWPAVPWVVVRTLYRGGKGSAWDFFRSLPTLFWANVVKRNLRLLTGSKPMKPHGC